MRRLMQDSNSTIIPHDFVILIIPELLHFRWLGECSPLGGLRKLLVLRKCHVSVAMRSVLVVDIVDSTHLLSSIKIVSIVFSRFHCKRHGSLAGST